MYAVLFIEAVGFPIVFGMETGSSNNPGNDGSIELLAIPLAI